MTTLFVTNPGQVVAMQNIGALPLTIFLENWDGFPAIRAAITNVSAQTAGNYQFLHTLKEYIYVYVFGERIGDMRIGGLLFSEACASPGAPSGIEQLSQYYNQYRLSKSGATLTIQIGTSGLARVRGFLVGARADLIDAQHQLGQFALHLKTLTPEAVQN
jgi:hypothetical protein